MTTVLFGGFGDSFGDTFGGATADPTTLTGQDGAPYLAVDVQPDNLTGVFRLDHSLLDGTDRLSWSTVEPGEWVNVVCDVQTVLSRRGVDQLGGPVPVAEAGTVTIGLSDTGHVFDPMTAGDVIHRGTPLRLRAWGWDVDGELWEAVLFTGQVDRVRVQYLHDGPPAVTITGMDLVGQLAAWEAEGYPDEDRPIVTGLGVLGQYAELALAETGIGELSPASHTDYSLDGDYVAPLNPMPMANPWQELVIRQETELGRLWVDRDNQLVVRGRLSPLDGPVRGTFSDSHGETITGPHCCVADAAVIYGVQGVNRVLAGRNPWGTTAFPDLGPEGELVRLDDEASQARHGVEVIDRRDLEISYTVSYGPGFVPVYGSLLPEWAAAVLSGGATPRVRVESVQPSPSPIDLDSAIGAWPAVLNTDVGDRWVFLFHPSADLLVSQTIGVLGVELDVTPDAWTVRWVTEESRSVELDLYLGLFVLDHSTLDSAARLAP